MPSPDHINGVDFAIKNGLTFDEAIKILDYEINKIKSELEKKEKA